MTTTTYTSYGLPATIDTDADGNLPGPVPPYGGALYPAGGGRELRTQPRPGSRALVLADDPGRTRADWIVAVEAWDPEYGTVTRWHYDGHPNHIEHWGWLRDNRRVLRVDAA